MLQVRGLKPVLLPQGILLFLSLLSCFSTVGQWILTHYVRQEANRPHAIYIYGRTIWTIIVD